MNRLSKLCALAISIFILPVPGHSQGPITQRSTNGDFNKLTEILPPPPDATAIARYSGVEVSMSSGAVNKTIALRAFTYRSLSVPVTLSYVSNGIKVNELPSRVGMGWAFQAGGSISRVVYGFDDFFKTRFVPSADYLPDTDNPQLTSYCELFSQGNYDSQPDVFSFNFNGYSGKFVFDHQGNIIQMPVSNLKIAFNTYTNTEWTFCITTPDGVKYFFGGANAKERTRKGGDLTTFPNYADNVWHLAKITHPAGYNIYFNYQATTAYQYQVGRSEAKYKAAFDSDVPLQYTWINNQGMLETEYMYGMVPPGSTTDEYLTTTFAVLQSITADDGSHMNFNYSTAAYPEKLLEGIAYYNLKNTCLAKYQLTYDVVSIPNSGSLPFLMSVKETDNFDHFLNAGHRFEYINKSSMPARFSKSQDHWGYFNNKINTTLIPTPTDPTLQSWFPNATADREVDAAYAGYGLLSSITYPTGGKDEIEYEANLITQQQDGNTIATATQSITSTSAAWGPESSGAVFTIYYDKKVTFKWHCDYVASGTVDPLHDGGKIRIANASGQTVYTQYLVPDASDEVEFSELPIGTYTLYVQARGFNVKTDGTVHYRSGTSPSWQDVNIGVGGMRVKKHTASEVLGNKPIITRYYYGKYTELNKSSAQPVPRPNYYKVYRETVSIFIIDGDCNPANKTFDHKAMYSNTINALYIFNGGPVNYSAVTVSHGGDNFENGGTEHKFFIVPDAEALPIRGDIMQGAPLTNSAWRSGRETETTTFKKVNGSFTVLQNTLNEYVDDDQRRYNDLRCWVINRDYAPICTNWSNDTTVAGPFPYVTAAYSIAKYYLTSCWSYMNKSTTKVYDENGQNPMTTINNFFYDDDRHLMLTRTEVLNSKGELQKTQIKYPHDFAATGNVYQDMVDKNIIAATVEQKMFNGTQLLERIMNNFDNTWYGDKHVVAVKNIEMQKGAVSESRFRYYKYDTYGNPLELAKENDARQSFLWDYSNTMPVAKISNAVASEVAYTSFEADGKGGWTYTGLGFYDASAPTGNKVFNLPYTNSIFRYGLTAGTYIVSYWSKNGQYAVSGSVSSVTGRTLSGWTYYEHKVPNPSSGTISITGNGLIDELRLYPEKAQMSTYTFEPLVGMTSACDASGRITYYQYDGYNRLVMIRDENRKILNLYCYNYADQVERCTLYSNVEKSGVFARSDCATGYTGTTITYTVPAGLYFSNISQLDADQMAERDKTIHGPEYANILGSCVLMCSANNCTGDNKRCVAGVCETGVKVCTGSVPVHGGLWQTTYHYEFSDGFWSQNFTEYTSLPCSID